LSTVFSGTKKDVWKLSTISLAIAVEITAATLATAASPSLTDWPMFGQNVSNTANNLLETRISTQNVALLKQKWVFTTGGDVSARAAVVNNVAYFPDWGGNIWAVNALTGAPVWGHQLSDYGLPAHTNARTSPAVANGSVYIGTQATAQGAYLLAINAATGALEWKTQLDPSPYAIISTSPTVAGPLLYTGVASVAEGGSFFGVNIASAPARGSVVAVNLLNGSILWQTFTTPQGYSGAGVWGSGPVVDILRGTVYAGTGNNYRAPDSAAPSSTPGVTYGACIVAGGTAASCNSPDNHEDSILALDLLTGAVKWAVPLVTWGQPFVTDGSDNWNVDCAFQGPQCPANPGPDYDFGSAPNEITFWTSTGLKTIIGAGQKSGIYYALDPDTGAQLWHTQVGPGSSLGGMEWGSASDGKRIYVAIANLYGIPSAAGSAGSWAALDPATGAILWRTADPNTSVDIGPVSVVNGVVYASSMAGAANLPTMIAMDASTGKIVWNFAAGSSVNAGATISGGMVFWGSGYAHLGIPGFTGNNRFYAFGF
jgi:polyvinyl alcohol dehydrogenase (cytochrome)